MIQTLNNMAELKQSGFGRPSPRHGLQLLYWFSNEYIKINSNEIVVKVHPKDGIFGFHYFLNRRECDDNICIKLLPEENYKYFEVGNLHLPASSSLPPYVRKNYGPYQDGNNMDRIIISMQPGLQVHKIFVTEHEDQKRFDPDHTYRINRDLLMAIRNLSLDDFLKQAGYITENSIFVNNLQSSNPNPPQSQGFWDYCTIL
ncbi:uncharacterized protein LOC134007868 [Osmerus eperlanus]|uniref:uncharacterized protein LOC134007868 n=1 Tax=Osmerus eperlanus TaxID=29151 RepID=UPI002E144F94